jgi:hypothetical protein
MGDALRLPDLSAAFSMMCHKKVSNLLVCQRLNDML